MNAVVLSLAKVAHLVDLVSQRQGTGKLVLTSGTAQSNMNRDAPNESQGEEGDRQWHLYFFQGRLVYAIDSFHRLRRWQRVLKQYCPDFVAEISSAEQLWEYKLLEQGITQRTLNANQAKGIIQTSSLEVFFELISCSATVTSQWQSSKLSISPITVLDAKQVLSNAKESWEQWQAKDLGPISPNLAPFLKQSPQQNQASKETSINLVQLLNGQNTLWDIAYQLRQPAWAVTLSLLALVRKGSVEFREVADLPKPVSQKSSQLNGEASASAKLNSYRPLIACIDDSPVVGHLLEKILTPSGYRLLKITEPLQQMGLLATSKPDLIFLDLVMPDTNGYNLCAFLRQTPVFQKTPIIILTSRDNLINRSKAQISGAVDFLSKPPDAKKVLQVIQKYLPSEATQKSQNSDFKFAANGSA